MTCPWTWERWV